MSDRARLREETNDATRREDDDSGDERRPETEASTNKSFRGLKSYGVSSTASTPSAEPADDASSTCTASRDAVPSVGDAERRTTTMTKKAGYPRSLTKYERPPRAMRRSSTSTSLELPSVVYEDDFVAAVRKPAGLNTDRQPRKRDLDEDDDEDDDDDLRDGLEDCLPFLLAPPPTKPAPILPRVCHRLDAPTSGLVLCAKTAKAMGILKRAFLQRKVSKTYHAVVVGRPLVQARATLSDDDDEDNHHDDHNGDGWNLVEAAVDKKPAATEWRVVRERALSSNDEIVASVVLNTDTDTAVLTLLEVRPLTGRTHQIRKHCTHVLKTPILGDARYYGPSHPDGLFLCATALEFPHPAARRVGRADDPVVKVSVDPPESFRRVMATTTTTTTTTDETTLTTENQASVVGAIAEK